MLDALSASANPADNCKNWANIFSALGQQTRSHAVSSPAMSASIKNGNYAGKLLRIMTWKMEKLLPFHQPLLRIAGIDGTHLHWKCIGIINLWLVKFTFLSNCFRSSQIVRLAALVERVYIIASLMLLSFSVYFTHHTNLHLWFIFIFIIPGSSHLFALSQPLSEREFVASSASKWLHFQSLSDAVQKCLLKRFK